ncbi:MAG: peroxiredoxin-like family protein [Candidatus Eiseniibacteriota bacterium]
MDTNADDRGETTDHHAPDTSVLLCLNKLEADLRARRDPALQERLDRVIADLAKADLLAGSLAVGDMAPDFMLQDAAGERVSLAGLLDRGPLVLTFFRGTWCPYCALYLRALEEARPAIEAAGATLVAISPQHVDAAVRRFRNKIGFEILSDLGNRVARVYGLIWDIPAEITEIMLAWGLDLPAINGTAGWELPIPATYVIAPDGTVRYAFADPNFRRRAEPADVLAALRDGAA